MNGVALRAPVVTILDRNLILQSDLMESRTVAAHEEPDPERRELLIAWAKRATERIRTGAFGEEQP